MIMSTNVIYDFNTLTGWIHSALQESMSPIMAKIAEMALVAICFLTFFALLGIVLIYVERKICAFFQQRLGPMRVGFWGTAQTIADMVKLLMKEPLMIKTADGFLFNLARRVPGRRRSGLVHIEFSRVPRGLFSRPTTPPLI